ncbi:MAG: replicative DNA helicase [Calditrichaeota bacterium]|nr:replicative DNA helicase [Candidatus Cloacimonadota bacterium]MCB1047184.1 replicative DNA helicase [Calditrichota bacterium]
MMDLAAERIPPHSPEAEVAVLGAMFIDADAVDRVTERLHTPEDFYLLPHRLIYGAILELANANIPVDLISVRERLELMGQRERRKQDLLAEAGGIAKLQELSMAVDSAGNVEYHADIVHRRALLRHIIGASTGLVRDAFSPAADPDELLNSAESAFFRISHQQRTQDMISMSQLMNQTMERLETMERSDGLLGVDTGFLDLNKMTSGLQRTDLVILAARPSMGKTAFALNLTLNAARKGASVGFFSLEMSAEQLAYRMISVVSGVSGQRLRTKSFNHGDETSRVSQAVNELSEYRIHIDETPGITMAELRSKARRLSSRYKMDLLVVDYLQLMTLPSSENHQLGVAAVSKALKGLAKELEIPVIALSQLSRQVEQRGGDKVPMLSDLRDSGAIEQDADLVFFVYRPEVYMQTDAEGNSVEGRAEIHLSKHRNGPTGVVRLHFEKETGRFRDSDPWSTPPPGMERAPRSMPEVYSRPGGSALPGGLPDDDRPF